MTFGQKLKMLRLKRGLTQKMLAEEIHLSKANVSKYESDDVEPNFDTLKAISAIFNVSIDYLLGENEKRENDISDINQLLFNEQQKLISIILDMSEGELKSVTEYAEFLKQKHNS